MPKHHDPGGDLYQEVQARQRNTTWPDAMVNSSSMDSLLWNGSPKATKVQRVGIFVWGALYLIAAMAFVMMAVEQHSITLGAFSVIVLAVGGRITFNAFLRRKLAHNDRHPHGIGSHDSHDG